MHFASAATCFTDCVISLFKSEIKQVGNPGVITEVNPCEKIFFYLIYIAAVILRQKNMGDTGTPGRKNFLIDTSDSRDAPAERYLAGHGY